MTTTYRKHVLGLLSVIVLFCAVACAPPPEGVGKAVRWSAVPGWMKDNHLKALPVLLGNCSKLGDSEPKWMKICAAAKHLNTDEASAIRHFFEKWFIPHVLINKNGSQNGLITGYFRPLLQGSLRKTEKFAYPIYRTPPDLVTVDLRELYPDLPRKPLRGRLVGKKVIPFYSRSEIDDANVPLKGNELFWVDDPVALFFAQIQGSCLIRLTDGKTFAVGYASQNGHPYVSIGAKLIEMGALKRQDVTAQSIKAWLASNPYQAQQLLNENPSYVFFQNQGEVTQGPLGKMGIPLTAGRSIAVDQKFIPLGSPVWLDTHLPDQDGVEGRKWQRLVFAQDIGGAINGAVRADVYWGEGEQAEFVAGQMKQSGKMYLFIPRETPRQEPAWVNR